MSEIALYDPSALLAESGLKTGWLIETLMTHSSEFKRAFGCGKVREVSAKDISEGEGYASKVYRVVIKFTGSTAHEYSLVMKVPTGECLQKLTDGLSDELKEACAFFEAFKGADGLPIPKVWFTRKTGTTEPGVILMEDLSRLGCRKGYMKALNAQQLRNIVRGYATVHAYHFYADDGVKLAIDAIPTKTTFKLFVQSGEKTLSTLTAAIPECNEGIPLMICQGDSGEHNLFFKKASDGIASNEVCAFLDWQIAFKCSPFFDIARFTMSFADAEVRREVEVDLVEEYYLQLKKGVESLGQKLDFGVDELREAYELAKIYHVLSAVGRIVFLAVFSNGKDPKVWEALREKLIIRAKFALVDAVESMRKCAPEYLAE